MSMPLEDVTREAISLPRHQRLSLARLLIELDDRVQKRRWTRFGRQRFRRACGL